jgi:hypothetical protein
MELMSGNTFIGAWVAGNFVKFIWTSDDPTRSRNTPPAQLAGPTAGIDLAFGF